MEKIKYGRLADQNKPKGNPDIIRGTTLVPEGPGGSRKNFPDLFPRKVTPAANTNNPQQH
jgi:hypothetical protein